eukprot:9555759-Alexandrium_andersonii.AAC.1
MRLSLLLRTCLPPCLAAAIVAGPVLLLRKSAFALARWRRVNAQAFEALKIPRSSSLLGARVSFASILEEGDPYVARHNFGR